MINIVLINQITTVGIASITDMSVIGEIPVHLETAVEAKCGARTTATGTAERSITIPVVQEYLTHTAVRQGVPVPVHLHTDTEPPNMVTCSW